VPLPEGGDDIVEIRGPREGFEIKLGLGDEVVDGSLKILIRLQSASDALSPLDWLERRNAQFLRKYFGRIERVEPATRRPTSAVVAAHDLCSFDASNRLLVSP